MQDQDKDQEAEAYNNLKRRVSHAAFFPPSKESRAAPIVVLEHLKADTSATPEELAFQRFWADLGESVPEINNAGLVETEEKMMSRRLFLEKQKESPPCTWWESSGIPFPVWFEKYVSIKDLIPFFVLSIEKFAEFLGISYGWLYTAIKGLKMPFLWPKVALSSIRKTSKLSEKKGLIGDFCKKNGLILEDIILSSTNFIVVNFGLSKETIASVEQARAKLFEKGREFLKIICFPESRDPNRILSVSESSKLSDKDNEKAGPIYKKAKLILLREEEPKEDLPSYTYVDQPAPRMHLIDWFKIYIYIKDLIPFFVIPMQTFANLLRMSPFRLCQAIDGLKMGFPWPNRQLSAKKKIRHRSERDAVRTTMAQSTAQAVSEFCKANDLNFDNLTLDPTNRIVRSFGLSDEQMASVEQARVELFEKGGEFFNTICFPKKLNSKSMLSVPETSSKENNDEADIMFVSKILEEPNDEDKADAIEEPNHQNTADALDAMRMLRMML